MCRSARGWLLISLWIICVLGTALGAAAAADVDPSEEARKTLVAYFETLGRASHLTVEQMGAAGGFIGMGTEPYAAAYRYWSEAWRAEHDYESFVAGWAGTAHVRLKQIHAAGGTDEEQRFFVETEHIEAADQPLRFGTFYYWGFFTLRRIDGKWQIVEGRMHSENPVWRIGGHQPWLGDPRMVAAAYLRSVERTPDGEGELELLREDVATVRIADLDSGDTFEVHLVRRQDGIWQVIRSILTKTDR